jgi:hypothetical protein
MSHSEWVAFAMSGWGGMMASLLFSGWQMYRFLRAGGNAETWRAIGEGRIWSVPNYSEPAATYFRRFLWGGFAAFVCMIIFSIGAISVNQ